MDNEKSQNAKEIEIFKKTSSLWNYENVKNKI